jgi:hypothetical protein
VGCSGERSAGVPALRGGRDRVRVGPRLQRRTRRAGRFQQAQHSIYMHLHAGARGQHVRQLVPRLLLRPLGPPRPAPRTPHARPESVLDARLPAMPLPRTLRARIPHPAPIPFGSVDPSVSLEPPLVPRPPLSRILCACHPTRIRPPMARPAHPWQPTPTPFSLTS